MYISREEAMRNSLAYNIRKFAREVGYAVQGDKDCNWLDEHDDTSLTYEENLWEISYTECPITYKYLASYDFHEKIIHIADRLVGHSRSQEIVYNLIVRIIEQEQQNDPNWKRQIQSEDDELDVPFARQSDFDSFSANEAPREVRGAIEKGE